MTSATERVESGVSVDGTKGPTRARKRLFWSWDGPWSARERFAFRWTFVFFFSDVLAEVLLPLPYSVSGRIRSWFSWFEPRNYPDWFKAFWPPCPGCDYNPMYWQAEFPWIALVALGVAILWTLVDRRSQHYHKLHAVMRVALRYHLAGTMFNFGAAKVAGIQFWALHTDAYLTEQPLGHWTARALMWNAMGQSFAFASFTGIGELVGGFLVLFRRTTTIAAMLLVFVSGTVFLLDALMNRGGITGSALWETFMAAALLVPALPQLRAFYVDNSAVASAREPRIIPGWVGRIGKVVMIFFVMKIYWWYVDPSRKILENPPGYFRSPHPLSGVFRVDSMTKNARRVMLRQDDTTGWAHIGLGSEPNSAPEMTLRGTQSPATRMFVINPDGGIREGYAIVFDTLKHTIAVDTVQETKPLMGHTRSRRSTVTEPFTYEQPDKDRIILRGVISGDTITAYLRRAAVSATLLFGSPRLVRSRYGIPLAWVR